MFYRLISPLLLPFGGLLVGCGDSAAPPAGPPLMPVPEVEVAEAVSRQIINYREYTGRTTAVDSVEIRARVSGYLQQSPRSESINTENNLSENDGQGSEATTPPATGQPASGEQASDDEDQQWTVTVNEGDKVSKGDLLFVIDPEPYRLAFEQSQGSLEAAKARLTQSNQELSRSTTLLERNAGSRSDYDSAIAAVAELQGQIDNLQATVARNQLDLDFTRVRSPIDGLIGRTLVTVGNLVIADSTILTTVVSVEPIYVEFDVDEQSVLDYRKRRLEGKVQSARDNRIAVRLGLANEQGYPHQGTIDFVNNTTDPDTGNTRLRAMFENQDGFLSPGLFSKIQVPFTAEYDATLIPSTAIAMDQQGRYAMVVGDDNKVSRRSIEIGTIVDDLTVIREGVVVGERVVVSGLQKIRPGVEVRTAAGDNP